MTGDAILNLLCNAYLFDVDIVNGRLEMTCDFDKTDESDRHCVHDYFRLFG